MGDASQLPSGRSPLLSGKSGGSSATSLIPSPAGSARGSGGGAGASVSKRPSRTALPDKAVASLQQITASGVDAVVAQYATYEEYLDSHIHPRDMFYLEDVNLCRQLVELGCRGGTNEVLSREEFNQRKRAAETVRLQKHGLPKRLASEGRNLDMFPVLHALADREPMVRNGKLMCIVFIRDTNRIGQEVSGYIDYAWRLKTENFEVYFDQRKRLLPRSSDLSFYNWDTQTPTMNHTPNFQVISGEKGLLFKNKRDRKVINVDPEENPGDNSATKRVEIKTHEFMQAVIFDHLTRQKI
eukprot:TRINITY_DN6520_c0_g1_i2.p1 TRINITY_DN6520_c0_g1~~TRINITY_DN6520_c0_g1_i2.p1  ORF type:complete len:298 (+),score=65.38 TRINITY_DN6520_c0_g1_i2:832-1725(+)